MVGPWTPVETSMPESDRPPQKTFADWDAVASDMAELIDGSPLNQRPRVVGICGSQGSGKSTLASIVVERLQQCGLGAVAVSLDDFYLTQAQRIELAQTVHPLLRTRGVPGTHDTRWLARVLNAIESADPAEGATIDLPIFDKGLDDRNGRQRLHCQILVLEGWCIGVQAQPDVLQTINALETREDADGLWRSWVNDQIRQNYEALWKSIDYWVQLRPPGFEQVVQWRSEQEQQIEPDKRMNAEALQRFIDHYERLTRWQWDCAPRQPGLRIELGIDHRVVSVEKLGEG